MSLIELLQCRNLNPLLKILQNRTEAITKNITQSDCAITLAYLKPHRGLLVDATTH